MGLLRADLQALANLPLHAAGRRVALGFCCGLLLLGLLSWWTAQELVARPDLLSLVHRRAGDSRAALLAAGLLPCPLVATWIGLALAQRQLFESPELPLWQQAPLPPWRPGAQVLLRAVFVTLLWAATLAGPFVASVLHHGGAPALAWALLPLALLLGTAPVLCVLLAVQIVLVRFFAGRALRLIFLIVGALASVAFSAFLLLGLFTPVPARARDLAAAVPDEPPWALGAAANLLDAAARGAPLGPQLPAAAAWLLLTAACGWFAARLHARAVERHRLAEPPARRHRGSWPATVAATIRRKEFAQLLQQPGALVGFLVFALLVVLIARDGRLFAGVLADGRLPPELQQVGALLALWFVAVLLVLYQHMGRLVMWDGPQWPLYMGAPCAPAAILRGKLQAVGLLLLWPLLLVGAAGAQSLGASAAALAGFGALALPGTLIALGVLAAVGTWPPLMRPDEGGHIAQGGRSFLAALVLVMLFELAMAPALCGWVWLTARAPRNGLPLADVEHHAPLVIAIAWLYGLATLALGLAIAVRNHRRLSLPR